MALTDLQALRDFIWAGRAIFTVVSKKTGKSYTFRVKRINGSFRVSVLTGPDNTHSYTSIFAGPKDWAPRKAWEWLSANIIDNNNEDDARALRALELVDVHPSANCGRCGRLLTDAESVKLGLGPICRSRG